jgi:hypothetical protein
MTSFELKQMENKLLNKKKNTPKVIRNSNNKSKIAIYASLDLISESEGSYKKKQSDSVASMRFFHQGSLGSGTKLQVLGTA